MWGCHRQEWGGRRVWVAAVGELDDPVVVGFPLEGEWLAERTPAYQIPSHGTDALGQRLPTT